MTRTEHLLSMLSEECAEVAQRASKAMRFGVDEVQPGQPLTNAERIVQEFNDLVAVMEMLSEAGVPMRAYLDRPSLQAKKAKVEKFLAYSAECGTLDR